MTESPVFFEIEEHLVWQKALALAHQSENFLFLNGNKLEYPQGIFPLCIAVGRAVEINPHENPFDEITKAHQLGKHLFGCFSYDLKNHLEQLESTNPDFMGSPECCFFEAEWILKREGNQWIYMGENPQAFKSQVLQANAPEFPQRFHYNVRQSLNKEQYTQTVLAIKNHILEGDVYELNLCIEFGLEDVSIDPIQTYFDLNRLSPMPFSALFKFGSDYIISASPERFLRKEGGRIISQPIKGTAARGKNREEDEARKYALRHSEKELSENMMIVDLVRNDLARTAIPGSIEVDELFGIYSFPQVHQMISTVSAKVAHQTKALDIIAAAFPMGSMTGAPKIMAMQLIEKYEKSKRGMFSGALGYISANGDFDLNVLIRSIFYNASTKRLSWQAGSAIVWDSEPELEYQECILKTKAIRKVLGLDDLID
jgi:para-aminobenzoate synthetase component I